MSYFTWNELSTKYPSVAKDLDASRVDSFWAPLVSGDLDAQIAKRYAVPLANTPSMFIKNLAIDMAYWQWTYKAENQSILKEYIDQRISGIIDGTIVLTDVTGAPLTQGSTQVFLTTSGTASSFGMNNPVDWHVDRQWADSFNDYTQYPYGL